MDDQPKSVKDLLVEAKDASELMVDLAYAAVFFRRRSVAQMSNAFPRCSAMLIEWDSRAVPPNSRSSQKVVNTSG